MNPLLKFLKKPAIKHQMLFTSLAVLFLILTVGFIIFNFNFLAKNLNQALGTISKPTIPQGFDIQGFEKLNLIKK